MKVKFEIPLKFSILISITSVYLMEFVSDKQIVFVVQYMKDTHQIYFKSYRSVIGTYK